LILALITAHVLGIRINPVICQKPCPSWSSQLASTSPTYWRMPSSPAHTGLPLQRCEPVPPACDILHFWRPYCPRLCHQNPCPQSRRYQQNKRSGRVLPTGWSQFCQLAGLSFLYDFLLTFGFYISVLTVFVEVRHLES
jgi:hypothetical protein